MITIPDLKALTEHGFCGVFAEMISEGKLGSICRKHEPVARRPRKRQTCELVMDLIHHQLYQEGTLAGNAAQLGGEPISDSAYAQRRSLLPVELFGELLEAGLEPLAHPDRHGDGFYKGWRLVGVDGTEVSVTNTAPNQILPKANARRAEAAFAKLKLVTAMELGLHNPLAAQVGCLHDYEVALALTLWPRLPKHSLVIVDRIYGVGKHVGEMLKASKQGDQALLVNVRDKSIKAESIKVLSDGSRLVSVSPGRRKTEPSPDPIVVRQICAELRTPEGKSTKVRLWSSLLDPKAYPAIDLVNLYRQRWEHELAYRELKLDVRNGDLLQSHTPETALQEIAAIILAVAAVARIRAAATEQLEIPARRISLRKLLLATCSLWEAFDLARDFLTKIQKKQMIGRYNIRLNREAILPERRKRTCQRAIRQPVSSWPRLIERTKISADMSITIEK